MVYKRSTTGCFGWKKVFNAGTSKQANIFFSVKLKQQVIIPFIIAKKQTAKSKTNKNVFKQQTKVPIK